jgi:hypothetical protein
LRWRLFIEEYNPIFHYIKGSLNKAADALSRLPFSERQKPHYSNSNSLFYPEKPFDILRHTKTAVTSDPTVDVLPDSSVDTFYSMVTDDPDLYDCFVHLPDQQDVPFRMDYQTIAEAQSQDAALLQQSQSQPHKVQRRNYDGTPLLCHISSPGGPWKIYLPINLLQEVVRWYHLALGHCGTSRLADTIRMQFFHPMLQHFCEKEVQKCDPCQRLKNVGRGHGETASREAPLLPWQDVAVDLIGPWTVSIGDRELKFSALTMIDMVTNLVEIVRIDNKSAAHVAMHFENTWLSRYPRPQHVIHDQGGEFMGRDFQHRLEVHNIKSVELC